MGKSIKANILDSAILEMDKDVTKQIFHLMMYTTNLFDVEIFKKSTDQVIALLPILKSALVAGYWRDHWIEKDDFTLSDILKVEYIDDINFKEDAFDYYKNYPDKNVLPDEMPPIKILVIVGRKSGEKLVVFIIHHSLTAPPGASRLIRYFADSYDAVLHNTTLKKQKNYRSLAGLMRAVGFKNIVYTVKKMMKKPEIQPIYQEICELDYDNEGIGTYGTCERLEISQDIVKKISEKYKPYNLTVNDILMYVVAKVIYFYNEKLQNKSTHIFLSIGVALNKYLKKDIFSVSNLAGRDQVIMKYEDVNDINKFASEFHEFKANPIGINFLIPFVSLAMLPISKQKKIWKSKTKDNLLKWSNRSFSTTNIGKLDYFVKPFGKCVKQIEFMASYGYSGLPLISASGYDGKITIFFSKYKDKDNLCIEVKNIFEYIIKNELAISEED